jgi:tetratricopeptide (TPR) repeat protein
MKKSLLVHVIVMVVAMVCGAFLAKHLYKEQFQVDPSLKDVSNVPIAGMHKFASDVDWMFFINYLGSLKKVDNDNIDDITQKLETILAYDPNFEKAYQVGVMSLSVEAPEQAVKFLEKACDSKNKKLQNNWKLPFYAGFILTHHMKEPDYAKALKFYKMAIKRSSGKPESYVVNSYLRALAHTQMKEGEKDLQPAMLRVLFNEWKMGSMADGFGSMDVAGNTGSMIPDLDSRLLKAMQEAKKAAPNNKDLGVMVEEIRTKVLVGKHLCDKCLTPYGPGEKFCSCCGNELKVYGVCPKCGTIMKGDFCTKCGYKKPAEVKVAPKPKKIGIGK